MAIDKESTGLPEIDPHRKTTKVNLVMIVAIAVFYALTFMMVFYFARHRHNSTLNRPSQPLENAPAKSP